ncbi:MAG: flagellar hook-associated protein FlgK [Solirubrobacteraceae bacterium]|nr:flagellar hook-associated protein FlgK [Solirubrobacteraceae bacterium]
MAQISSFNGLQTSLRGLLAHQRMLDVASHNISNADTEGYTRQQVVTTAAAGILVQGASSLGGTNWLGQGVDVASYRRLRDDYLDVSMRAQNMLLGQRTTLAAGLSRADDALNEPSTTGLSAQLDKFWSSFQTLANNPSDSSARITVIASAKALTTSFSDLDARLATVQNDAASEYAALTTGPSNQVGEYAKQLAELNDRIGLAQAAGQQPNDMLDQRDLILDKLSGLAQISVTTNPNGKISVAFGDATNPLVDGSTQTSTANWPQTLTNPGGKLGGLLGVQATVQGYRTQLDGVASSLITGVNAVHGAPPFFTGTGSTSIAVNVTAASLRAGSGTTPESNDFATAIAGMRDGSIDTAYGTLVGTVGADTAAAQAQRDLSTTLVSDVEARRQAVAGVSLDEEMAGLIQFQRGYQASARTMSAMDQMLDTLINRTGTVGL